MMMSTPTVIITFLGLLNITIATAKFPVQQCLTTKTCGPTLDVHFPFGIGGDNRCAYPGFNLSCGTGDALPTLQLPNNSGNFTVQGINYLYQEIYISDPGHCFPRRLLAFNLSGSPFRVVSAMAFVLSKCPSNDVHSGFFRSVACLSNQNYTVIALPESSADSAPQACEEMERARVPGGWTDDDGLGGVALLQWDWPDCRSCEAEGGLCGFKAATGLEVECPQVPSNGLSTRAKYGIALGIGIPCILCAMNSDSSRHHHQTGLELSTAVAPHPRPVRVPDQATAESYPMAILGSSKELTKPRENGTCPICLSEYRPKEALRTIPECNHYFHAHCIDEWLKLNSTCPVCRADTPDRWISQTRRLIS